MWAYNKSRPKHYLYLVEIDTDKKRYWQLILPNHLIIKCVNLFFSNEERNQSIAKKL
jgi:hypothetical protein